MTTWSPGVPFKVLLAGASMSYIRDHLGEELCALFDLLEGGVSDDDRLRVVASIDMVPGPKRRELARRLDPANDEQTPLEHLQGLKGAADERREFLESFSTGQKGCRWGYDGRSRWKSAKRSRSRAPGGRACAPSTPHSADARSWLDAGSAETGSSKATELPSPTGTPAHTALARGNADRITEPVLCERVLSDLWWGRSPTTVPAGSLPLPTPLCHYE